MISVKNTINRLLAALITLSPVSAYANGFDQLVADKSDTSAKALMGIAVFLMLSAILVRLWMGIMNHSALHHEAIEDIEKRGKKPYLPSFHIIVTTIVCTAGLFLLSLNTMGGVVPFDGPHGTSRAAVFFGFVGIVSIIAQYLWPRAKHYVFAFSVGTLITFILLGFHKMLFTSATKQDPFFMALGILSVVLVWRFMFGPWRPQVKATVLGTFILWVAVNMILKEDPSERTARLLATIIAFIPAMIWCVLFLREHKQRLSMAILMFFAGMLSTAPILFYDAMVRNKVELHFFLFTITPENFTRSSNAFVTGNLVGVTGMRSTIVATLISFLLVGLIEEVSKFWVLKKSGRQFFSSIDDVLQLGIIVAIGFAFAENVINPSYFMAFVREYLINPVTPNWGAFMGNVLGRAILTNMVHILSSGVFAYFYGKLLFADALLEEEHKRGKMHLIPRALKAVFRIPEKTVFRNEHILMGLVCSVLLHGLFNFLVTLPDLLPGNPRTLGDVFNAAPGSPLHYIALLIIPSMFYVVGGFWILSILFYKKQCMQERGVLVETDTYVPTERFFARYAKS